MLKIDGTATSGAIAISNANQTLEIGTGGSLTISAAESITNGTIQLDGGTLTDASGLTIDSGATLTGSARWRRTSRPAPVRSPRAAGVLDLTGTVSGPTFTIATGVGLDPEVHRHGDGGGAIAINSANQTLEIGTGGNLTIGAAESITNGTIQLSGGTLTDASGLTIGSGATLTGSGTVAANIAAGAGTITASGGVLDSVRDGGQRSGVHDRLGVGLDPEVLQHGDGGGCDRDHQRQPDAGDRRRRQSDDRRGAKHHQRHDSARWRHL